MEGSIVAKNYKITKKLGGLNLSKEFKTFQIMSFCLVLLDWLAFGLAFYAIRLKYGTMIFNTFRSICLGMAAFHMIAQYLMVKRLVELTQREKETSILHSTPTEPTNAVAPIGISLGI